MSNDPKFAEKLKDVVGLYVDTPAHAVVLSVDEKSQIEALDRTQPGLSMKPGRAGTMTHDYKSHGTTTLLAALNILDGTVIGRNMQRHRHQEFIRFLNTIEEQVTAGKVIHAIVDNDATHKHPRVRQWLARHPRWTFHFTPTSASWLNAVEGFFAKLTRRRLKRGVFDRCRSMQFDATFVVPSSNHFIEILPEIEASILHSRKWFDPIDSLAMVFPETIGVGDREPVHILVYRCIRVSARPTRRGRHEAKTPYSQTCPYRAQ